VLRSPDEVRRRRLLGRWSGTPRGGSAPSGRPRVELTFTQTAAGPHGVLEEVSGDGQRKTIASYGFFWTVGGLELRVTERGASYRLTGTATGRASSASRAARTRAPVSSSPSSASTTGSFTCATRTARSTARRSTPNTS
jgi:hypothetical protein